MGAAAGFVIVGAGQAGAWVAKTLRQEGFTGRVLLIGDEPHWPYERPPLSKAVLRGEAHADTATLLDEAEATRLGLEAWRGDRVVAVDRAGRVVRCSSGRAAAFETLFLTMGGQARALPGMAGSSRMHVLRTWDDAARIGAAFATARRVLVLGGGWIGLEVAASARAMGLDVVVVEAGPRLCARAVPAAVSEFLRHLHESHGVKVLLGQAATLTDDAGGVQALLADGRTVPADHAVVGVGMAPDTTLAADCGLDVDDGILVDATGRKSDPGIYAAGDIARHPNRFARRSMRLESWANAQNQAITAARAALGHSVRYDEIPWFWSDQYDVNLQIVGCPEAAGATALRGDLASKSACWLASDAAGRSIGGIAVNAPRDLRTIRKALQAGTDLDAADWAGAGRAAVGLAPVGRSVLPT